MEASIAMTLCSLGLLNHPILGAASSHKKVVIIKESGITWMPDDTLEPLVKELDDTAAPRHADFAS